MSFSLVVLKSVYETYPQPSGLKLFEFQEARYRFLSGSLDRTFHGHYLRGVACGT